MAVKSRRSSDFRKLYDRLPVRIQALAVKNFELWQKDPSHPSLNFEEWHKGRWSARVGAHHRVLAIEKRDGSFLWYWIGTHEAYNKLLREQR